MVDYSIKCCWWMIGTMTIVVEDYWLHIYSMSCYDGNKMHQIPYCFSWKHLVFLLIVHRSKGKLIQVLNDQIMCFWNWHTFDFSVMVSHNAGCVENESDHWSINTSQVWLFIYCLLFVYGSAGIAGIQTTIQTTYIIYKFSIHIKIQ